MYRPESTEDGVEIMAPQGWMDLARNMPHRFGDRAKRNWGHPWHSLCSYQGKLKPAIANSLVTALMPSAYGRILDPFAGVGTIPLEARLSGYQAFGFDISPAAIAISRAKLEPVRSIEAWAEVDALERWISMTRPGDDRHIRDSIRFNGPVESYFHPDTFAEVLAARSFFHDQGFVPPARALVLGCLLHILHGNRPYALSRRSHPITPFAPTGPAERRELVPRLKAKIQRVLDVDTLPSTGSRVFDQDATLQWPDCVDELDAIITSPPFFDSTRFYSANWMRLWFSGWNSQDFVNQPDRFVERRQKKDFEVYDSIFRQAASRLKPGGYLALHLGKSAKCDMADALVRVGQRNLRFIHFFSEDVGHCESHGIRDKGSVTDHQFVLFKR